MPQTRQVMILYPLISMPLCVKRVSQINKSPITIQLSFLNVTSVCKLIKRDSHHFKYKLVIDFDKNKYNYMKELFTELLVAVCIFHHLMWEFINTVYVISTSDIPDVDVCIVYIAVRTT